MTVLIDPQPSSYYNPGMQNVIGIFGGTFNPVHLGHIHVARELLQKLPLNEIRFLPCYTPVHRATPSVSVEHRLNMLKLALEANAQLLLDLHEIERAGPSFMIDTLRDLKTENPDVALCLIIGIDAYAALNEWKHWQQLTDYCHLIVVNRPGYQLNQTSEVAEFAHSKLISDANELTEQNAGNILHVAISPSSVSGSDFRHSKRQGKNLADMVPKAVWNYIQQHQLYQ